MTNATDDFDIGYQWALPPKLKIPEDVLQARLDFYNDTTVLYLLENGTIVTKIVSPREVALAFLKEIPLNTGVLPESTLWWIQRSNGAEVALWQPPKVWTLALQMELLEPPRRFKIPMPGLIFGCMPNKPPRVFAARKRPTKTTDCVYHAPLFNIFHSGETCPGTNKYPSNVIEVPHSFMVSYFSLAANYSNRSKSHPDNLLDLWIELEGKETYPMNDLVEIGPLEKLLK